MPSSNRNQHQPPAVLIGLDSLQGLQSARILARYGIPVIALAAEANHFACQTNACEKIIFADTASENLITILETLGAELKEKAILFPCEDGNVLLVSRHRQRLQKWYHLVLPDSDVVELLMDKVSFYKYAQKNGFPIPPTYFLQCREDAEHAVAKLSFPCILKPHNSATPDWERNCRVSAFKVSCAEELLDLYDRYHRWTTTLIAQGLIEGPESNLYACNCYFNAASELVVSFNTRKLRQWPPNIGIGSLREECSNDIVLNETIRLFKSVNYKGLGYVEMKCDERSGKYFIVEPNIGRPTGGSATSEAAEVELLYTMYCDAIGRDLPVGKKTKHVGLKWIYLRQDMQAAFYRWRNGDLTLGEWWQSWRGRKAFAVFSWRDPLPFLSDWARTARVLLSKKERRKRVYANPEA